MKGWGQPYVMCLVMMSKEQSFPDRQCKDIPMEFKTNTEFMMYKDLPDIF